VFTSLPEPYGQPLARLGSIPTEILKFATPHAELVKQMEH